MSPRKRTLRYEVRYQSESMWDYFLDVPRYLVLKRAYTYLGAVIWLKLNADKRYKKYYKIVQKTEVIL